MRTVLLLTPLVGLLFGIGCAAEAVPPGDSTKSAASAGIGKADNHCDYNWTGTAYENACPDSWIGTSDGCDCGCQVDDPDCGEAECSDDSDCPMIYCITTPCPSNECVDGECVMRLPSDPECDYDWTGSWRENNCPSSWLGTGDGCDCGCQRPDPDCGPTPGPHPCAAMLCTEECIVCDGVGVCVELGGSCPGTTPCGPTTCPEGMVCCNSLAGICTPPGGICAF